VSSAAALLDDFAARIVAKNPQHASFLASSLSLMSAEAHASLSQYIDYCLAAGLDIGYLADCYNTITIDTQLEQIYFRKHKRYRWSQFSQVADKVYFNDTYMRKYMYGLALTSFLWPNHAAIHDFFRRTFPRDIGGRYLEIGPGHGYYLMEAARLGGFDTLVGVDISATSLALTRDIVRHSGVDRSSRITLIATDFLAFFESSADYSCIVMGEVLEHVEEPARFLRKIAEMSGDTTHIYITTCINAPAIDHIYLFCDPAEIVSMANDCGLAVVEQFCASYVGKTLEECRERQLAVNIAYVMKRA
jgi:2-polyprenyl-3-methyl-5-hydroxy-6-metoxy-1,4-benzoquinol methylase